MDCVDTRQDHRRMRASGSGREPSRTGPQRARCIFFHIRIHIVRVWTGSLCMFPGPVRMRTEVRNAFSPPADLPRGQGACGAGPTACGGHPSPCGGHPSAPWWGPKGPDGIYRRPFDIFQRRGRTLFAPRKRVRRAETTLSRTPFPFRKSEGGRSALPADRLCGPREHAHERVSTPMSA